MPGRRRPVDNRHHAVVLQQPGRVTAARLEPDFIGTQEIDVRASPGTVANLVQNVDNHGEFVAQLENASPRIVPRISSDKDP